MSAVSCPICMNGYETVSRQPDRTPRLLLTCGHTICAHCIVQQLERKNIAFECPFDRRVFTKPDGKLTIRDFPPNHGMIEAMEASAPPSSAPPVLERQGSIPGQCERCAVQPSMIRCKQCEIGLCIPCDGEHHAFGKMKQHERSPIQQEAKTLAPPAVVVAPAVTIAAPAPAPVPSVSSPSSRLLQPPRSASRPRPFMQKPLSAASLSKPHLTVAIIGPPGSGKSTLLGNLLTLAHPSGVGDLESKPSPYAASASSLDAKTLSASVMRTPVERQRGRSEDLSHAYTLETATRLYTLIDTPGDLNYRANLSAGLAQADVSILVVEADPSMQEETGNPGGIMTYPVLAFTFGHKHIIPVVNKLDQLQVNENAATRFQGISSALQKRLQRIGYKVSELEDRIMPVSATQGLNLIAPAPASGNYLSFFRRTSLLAQLDALPLPDRKPTSPLRLSVLDTFSHAEGVIVSGRVAAGTLSAASKVVIGSRNPPVAAIVASIYRHGTPVTSAAAGQFVSVLLKDVASREHLNRGDVLGEWGSPTAPRAVSSLQVQIVVMGTPNVAQGFIPTVCLHSASTPMKFTRLLSCIDKRTGRTLEQDPNVIQAGQAGIVTLTPVASQQLICAEPFSERPMYGRVAFWEGKTLFAVGIVKSVTTIDRK